MKTAGASIMSAYCPVGSDGPRGQPIECETSPEAAQDGGCWVEVIICLIEDR